MNTDTGRIKVVLDTNILISAIGFDSNPRKVLNLVLERKILAISSPSLRAEFEDVVFKKFPLLAKRFEKINKQLKKAIKIVRPTISLNAVRDKTDNHVLEAAVEGKCNYVVTGDKDLLNLGSYGKIKIVTATEFLSLLEKN